MTTDNQAVEALMKLAWGVASVEKAQALRAAIAAALAAERRRALEDAAAQMAEVATWGGSHYYRWHMEAVDRISALIDKESP